VAENTGFEKFVHEHGAALVRLARLLTGDPHRAEDLAQDVLHRRRGHRRLGRRRDHRRDPSRPAGPPDGSTKSVVTAHGVSYGEHETDFGTDFHAPFIWPFLAALDAVRDGGTVVVQTGYYPGVRLSRDLREPIRRALTIVGSFSFCRRGGTDDFTEGLALLADDARWTTPFVGQRYALADLPRALADLRASSGNRPAKAVLTAS
jgi:threonine dehydrogenase-like Zn-dependent dehydrogenase